MHEILLSPFIKKAGNLWQLATEADFLNEIDHGTLPREAFVRWLEQDYLFAKGLTCAQAVMISKTPRLAQKILIEGLKALDDELDWFEKNANEEGVNLEVEHHPVCKRYVDYLISTAYSKPYEVNLAMLFGVEVAYLAAWSSLTPEGPYAEYVRRWSNKDFVEYVRKLGEQADENRHPDQQNEFNHVLRHERDFWAMTVETR